MLIRPEPLDLLLDDEEATLALGGALGAALSPEALLITLDGPLGAGKTTLVRGLLRGQGYSERVVSPTYTLMEIYSVDGHTFVHLDLYRIADPEELEFLGLRERLEQDQVLVEWPQKGAGWLPPADLAITLSTEGNGRRALLAPGSACGELIVARLARDPALKHLRRQIS